MTTGQQVFDIAMGMMDEVVNGLTDTGDTKEYKDRTLLILNALAGELYPYSDTYSTEDGEGRPIVAYIRDLNKPIDLDDYLCRTLLPYGLAAHLLLDENPSAASFFQQRYEELFLRLQASGGGIPLSGSEDIVDVYGPNGGMYPYNEFSSWS
jgi:hypothetical protein